jgi:hypothetical protein
MALPARVPPKRMRSEYARALCLRQISLRERGYGQLAAWRATSESVQADSKGCANEGASVNAPDAVRICTALAIE